MIKKTIKGIIKFIKRHTVGFYDVEEDKIIADKGGLAYYHEKRHQKQFSNDIIKTLVSILFVFAQAITVIFLITGLHGGLGWKAIFSATGIGYAPYAMFVIFLEIDATLIGIYDFIKSKREVLL